MIYQLDINSMPELSIRHTHCFCRKCKAYGVISKEGLEMLEEYIFAHAQIDDPEEKFCELVYEPGILFLETCPECLPEGQKFKFSPADDVKFYGLSNHSINLVCGSCDSLREDRHAAHFPLTSNQVISSEKDFEEFSSKQAEKDVGSESIIYFSGFQTTEEIQVFLSQPKVMILIFTSVCKACYSSKKDDTNLPFYYFSLV